MQHTCDNSHGAHPLDAVRCAAHRHREAREAVRRAAAERESALREAHRAGVSLTLLSLTVGVSVPRIHQLVNTPTEPTP